MPSWSIDPLPDFLSDHTLAGEAPVDRLHEVVSRWVQWLGTLWSWHDRATFALRYLAGDGRIRTFLEARSHDDAEEGLLVAEVGVLLRAHRLGDGNPLPGLAQVALEEELSAPTALVELRQFATMALWQVPQSALANHPLKRQLGELQGGDLTQPLVIYPWWAPGGPFLLPMESLISQPCPCTLSVYLQPTELEPHEQQWLSLMAREAQSLGERNLQALGAGAGLRQVDPAATLAGRLYIANLRRLSANPFLVAVHCGAERLDVVRSLAGAFQSLIQEMPFDRPQQDDERLPSAASTRIVTGTGAAALPDDPAIRQFETLRFLPSRPDDRLWRLPYLVDARGAALAFRLPISVRGGVPGVSVRQLAPDFHPGPRVRQKPDRHVELGRFKDGGLATIPVAELTKHVLICGFTGSGKTVTALRLLHQLWCDHRVPFLVLESAKQEYRGLLGVPALRDDLRVYTIGNELCAPIRLNPFELLPGVRVEAHVSRLQTCFEGAIPPIGPSSSVIAESLLLVYERSGWSLTDVCPVHTGPRRRFPRLSDFVRTVEEVITGRGYEGEVKSNLTAALVGRLRPLLLGSKGRTFDCERSAPSPEELLTRPTVLEMNDLNVEDKALVVMFLLTMLREYRERHPGREGALAHVALVEEAHNILENVASKGDQDGAASADTRYKAVEAFSHLLTEIRALGQGLIIADQSPQKLARDALRNTNLQIAHQLRDASDRKAIADAMIMEKEQADFLGKLPPGHVAVFHTGLEKATFLRVEHYTADGCGADAQLPGPGAGFLRHLDDSRLAELMEERVPSLRERRGLALPFPGCAPCRAKCRHRDAIFPAIAVEAIRDRARAWITNCYLADDINPGERWDTLFEFCHDTLAAIGEPVTLDGAWCLTLHAWHIAATDQTRDLGTLDDELHERFIRLGRSAPPHASTKGF